MGKVLFCEYHVLNLTDQRSSEFKTNNTLMLKSVRIWIFHKHRTLEVIEVSLSDVQSNIICRIPAKSHAFRFLRKNVYILKK